jgi:hypothetical protein
MLRITPHDADNALEEYWARRIAGDEKGAREILRELSERGVPLPFDPD